MIDGGIRMPSVPPAQMTPVAKRTSYLAFSIAGSASRPISVTTAPTMPVAVANSVQVTSAATASEPGSAARGDVQRREQPVDDVGALDDVAHEQEQRDRRQHVVRHDRIGLVDEQVEDAVVEEAADP